MNDIDLFKRLGLEKLSGHQQLNLTKDLSEVVLDRIANRLELLLSSIQIEAINQAATSSDDDAIDLINKYLPNFGSIVQEETDSVKHELINTHSDVMKKLGF